jgi:hypothetical protein
MCLLLFLSSLLTKNIYYNFITLTQILISETESVSLLIIKVLQTIFPHLILFLDHFSIIIQFLFILVSEYIIIIDLISTKTSRDKDKSNLELKIVFEKEQIFLNIFKLDQDVEIRGPDR